MSQNASAVPVEGQMTHRQILEALSGLLIAMFVGMLSGTVVTNALPRIVGDLHGSQTGYTWVVVATMLAMTATTPIWGKLADLFSKKLLVQIALAVFVVGSALAGISQSMEMLISARVITGIGVGGTMSLIQIIIGSMVPPRERGRYSGYIGAVFALATVSGPLIGGVIVDSSLGWRGCFYVGLPFAMVAFIVLQRTLKLPVYKREVKIDYLGSFLLVGGVSLLLVWVSLAGAEFAWWSTTTAVMVIGGLLILAAAVFVEAKVATEPVVPMWLFKDRTVSLATLATIFVGIAMFGATVYLSEFFQMSHGMSPTEAGLMSLWMVLAMMGLGILSGKVISDTGRWKMWLVGGLAAVVVGVALLATIDHTTNLVQVGCYMAILGAGVGATQQNLILAVQNNVDQANIGAATSVISFFRTMGGTIGVSALGALLSSQVAQNVENGAADLVASGQVTPDQLAGLGDGGVPHLDGLPQPVAQLFAAAFGDATGHIFLLSLPFAVLALICVTLMKETRLRTTLDDAEFERVNPDAAHRAAHARGESLAVSEPEPAAAGVAPARCQGETGTPAGTAR
ncbi:MDR family MFS transporter [Nocardioides insulae]|uniref:MDR family MFS transporter n=1 Tax=Nocardioides insulae TaxID=394734 RepID=UPI00041C2590|nr:MDR family MFS transporter [Nocardioides insulae]